MFSTLNIIRYSFNSSLGQEELLEDFLEPFIPFRHSAETYVGIKSHKMCQI